MKSIQQLIEYLVSKGDPDSKRLYDALKQIDDNTKELNGGIDNSEKKNMKYYCLAEINTYVSIGPGVSQTIAFDLTNYPQFGNMHDNVINNTKFFIRRNGVYNFSAHISLLRETSGATTGYIVLSVQLFRNGGLYKNFPVLEYPGDATDYMYESVSGVIYCYKDDYFIVVVQNSTNISFGLHTGPKSKFGISERMEDLNPSEYGLLDPSANMR